MNTTTARLLRRIERLPMRKQAELLQQLDEASPGNGTKPDIDFEDWKARLLKTSVWPKESLKRIEEAREWMNSWKPGSSWTRRY